MKHNPSEIETQSFLSWALESRAFESKPILFQPQTAASCFELGSASNEEEDEEAR